MVSLFAVDTAPGRTELAPGALLQLVDPVLYDLDAAVAWFVEVLDAEKSTAPIIEAALAAIEDAVTAIGPTSDALELAAIVEQLTPRPEDDETTTAADLAALLHQYEVLSDRRDELAARRRVRRVVAELDQTLRSIDQKLDRESEAIQRAFEANTGHTMRVARTLAARLLATLDSTELKICACDP